MKPTYIFMHIFAVLCIVVSCNVKQYEIQRDRVIDGKYDSEYPTQPVSGYLREIVQTVHMVSILAFYESMEFRYSDRVTLSDINGNEYQSKIKGRNYFQKPASGTATLIYYKERRLALMTCAHILNFPDTLYAYFKDEDDKVTNYLQSIAFRSRQNNHIVDIPGARDFEVLAMDEDSDIAIIGKQLPDPLDMTLAVFNYPAGKASGLEWGTLVYLAGYPRGKKMVATSLVSSPNRDRAHTFLIDATFPRGISGGIVLALRDGVPNFEVVGMINAISAESKNVLIPDTEQKFSDLNLLDKYKGDLYVDNIETLYYGVTYVVSIEAIQDLIRRNNKPLSEKGYFPELFFQGKSVEYVTE